MAWRCYVCDNTDPDSIGGIRIQERSLWGPEEWDVCPECEARVMEADRRKREAS